MVELIMAKRFIENQAAGSLSAPTDGTIPVVLITPGQGSSGYYHEEIIRDYAPVAFPKGTHVYLDHLKEGETRTAEKLLGHLTEDTVVNENGEATNRFKPLSKHREWVEELAPLVGLSVSVMGDGRKGEINGRQTVIVESLEPHVTNSVDLVPYAGRGGKFLESLLEEANEGDSERTPTEPQAESTKGKTTMLDPKDVEALAEAFKKVLADDAAAKEAKAKADADAAAAAEANRAKSDDEVAAERKELADALVAVESAELADSTKARLRESLIKGESVDVAAAIEAEKKFVEELTASRGLKFTEGFGSSAAGGDAADTNTVKGW